MRELERIWPDEERRESALTRLLVRVTTGGQLPNERSEELDADGVRWVAASAMSRIHAAQRERRRSTSEN